MADIHSAESYRSRYGIEKLNDHNYHTWSFQCQMLLGEKKVWNIVNGKCPRPETFEQYPEEEQTAMTAAAKKGIEKSIADWDEKNDEALRIICFTVIDRLQGPIQYGGTAKGAWDELQKVHAPRDKQRKYSLLRRLYRLDMVPGTALRDHEETFDVLVQNLLAIGKVIDAEELIILYANSLPVETFGNWIQTQIALIDNMSITDFKGRVREEARRLNLVGQGQGLGIDDSDTVQANFARQRQHKPKQVFGKCRHCGYTNHTEENCHKKIAEDYLAKQARREQSQQKPDNKRNRNRNRNQQSQQSGPNANVANADNNNNNSSPAYSAIFGGLAYCCKAAVNGRIRRINGVWVKDCGATHHMNHDKTIFRDYHKLKHRLYVGGIGSGLLAVGIGNVPIMDKAGHVRVLENVLHVPKLKNGLMSLTQLALKGWKMTLEKSGCTVSHDDFSIHSPITNGLCWWVHTSTTETNAFIASANRSNITLDDWHERLGHVSKDTLMKFGTNAIEDFDIKTCDHSNDDNHQCEPCAYGKQHRAPFKSVPKRRSKPLESVNSDLCESNVVSMGGGKIVLTFTDNATNYGRVMILPNKNASTVLAAFKDYQAWAERQSGHKIKALHTDRGTEYMGEMIEYIKSQGIEHNPTAAYSPQSNGVAERMNRTLFDMACPMLDAAGAPVELWAEAILTACHIRNRLPSRSLNGMSPHEAWTGQKPRVGHIRKFGCLVYRHINKKTGRKKLHRKSMKGYLVGYESTGIYRIYHPQTKTIKVSRDVLFCEDEFINVRRPKPTNTLVKNDSEHSDSEAETLVDDDVSDCASVTSHTEQSDKASPVVQEEIAVEPLPKSTGTKPAAPLPQPNRRLRRAFAKFAKAFTAALWPANYREAMSMEDAEQWEQSIQRELASLYKNQTWTVVPRPKDAKVVKSRWVFRIKDNGIYKARFCAKGFTQRWGEDYDETYAPVAKYTSIRTLFAILAGRRNVKVHQMDVNTAFLYSDLDEVVYVEQPEGFAIPGKEDWVLLLNKALYGLKQSPRAWFLKIAPTLVGFDFKQCDSDSCIFVYTNDKDEKTYIALYVDDFIIAGENEDDIMRIKQLLAEQFEMKDLGIAKKFLGMEIEYGDDGSIKIHQEQYIQQLLLRHGMEDCSPLDTPMDTSVKLCKTTDDDALADEKEYASIVGGLMFAACVTRPDIMCAAGQLSQFLNNPSSKHLAAAKRVLRYLKGTTTLGITYCPPPMRLTGYSDANWAGDIDTRRSTTGYVVMINNGAVAWRSQLQPTVALSTMEAEYMALTEATKELIWIRKLLAELGYFNNTDSKSTELYSDSQSAIALSKNPVSHARAKHIDIRHHFIREAIQDKIIWVQYIPTSEMTADSLTKALGREKHEKCAARMGMTL